MGKSFWEGCWRKSCECCCENRLFMIGNEVLTCGMRAVCLYRRSATKKYILFWQLFSLQNPYNCKRSSNFSRNYIEYYMIHSLFSLAELKSGVYARTGYGADVCYLQGKYFDEEGRLKETLVPDLAWADVNEKHLLERGDVLIAARGQWIFAAEVGDWIPSVASTTFLVARVYPERLLPGYLVWYLNHPDSKAKLQALSRGTNIPAISLGMLKDFPIAVPTLAQQEKILAVDKLRLQEKNLSEKVAALRNDIIQQSLIQYLNSSHE